MTMLQLCALLIWVLLLSGALGAVLMLAAVRYMQHKVDSEPKIWAVHYANGWRKVISYEPPPVVMRADLLGPYQTEELCDQAIASLSKGV